MSEDDPKPIEHRETNAIWWVIWPIIAFCWIGRWYFDTFDWAQIALGGFTGIALAIWAIEITGDKVPNSWRKPRRTR